jgi:hypothetical protein
MATFRVYGCDILQNNRMPILDVNGSRQNELKIKKRALGTMIVQPYEPPDQFQSRTFLQLISFLRKILPGGEIACQADIDRS